MKSDFTISATGSFLQSDRQLIYPILKEIFKSRFNISFDILSITTDILEKEPNQRLKLTYSTDSPFLDTFSLSKKPDILSQERTSGIIFLKEVFYNLSYVVFVSNEPLGYSIGLRLELNKLFELNEENVSLNISFENGSYFAGPITYIKPPWQQLSSYEFEEYFKKFAFNYTIIKDSAKANLTSSQLFNQVNEFNGYVLFMQELDLSYFPIFVNNLSLESKNHIAKVVSS